MAYRTVKQICPMCNGTGWYEHRSLGRSQCEHCGGVLTWENRSSNPPGRGWIEVEESYDEVQERLDERARQLKERESTTYMSGGTRYNNDGSEYYDNVEIHRVTGQLIFK